MSKSSSSQVLPQRFALIFKQLVRFYETKQYKKGLRAAEQILKAHPDHGESLAMKGLILNCMGPEQQSQSLAMIKRGLLSNMQSHICWHVLGLYHRAAREYAQAIKAYLRALHIDPDNIQILRDLSLLQVQIRDLSGYEETRRRILVLQPGGRHNWLAYSVAACLGGQRQRALDILSAYRRTLDQDKSYEYSEMILFQLTIMIDEGLLTEALKFAQDSAPFVVDLLTFNEIRANLLLKLGRKDEAKHLYRQLLDCNPDHADYHTGWRLASDLDQSSLILAYDEFNQQYPTSNLCKILPLHFITDLSIFTSHADQYLRNGLHQGIPSLFRCVRQFYSDPMKGDVISNLIIKYAHEEPGTDAKVLLYAEHLDFIHNHDDALNVLNERLEMTGGELDRHSIDLLVLKARVLKHIGAHLQAHSVMDQARLLDLQDRFLNTKTVKYALRAGLLSEAENVVSLFLRDGDTVISLFDMQCMWYELALGAAYAKRSAFGPALKKFNQVDIHFSDIIDDQFDFHMYCLRRQTLSVYISMLKWEDTIRGHRFAVKAAVQSAEIYLKLRHRSLHPVLNHVNAIDAELNCKSPADLQQSKREIAKSRRAQNKAAKGSSDGDPDPNGESFLKDVDYLTQARHHVHKLEMFAPQSMDTYVLSATLYTCMHLPLRVLHALLQAVKLPDASRNHAYQKAALTFALSYTPSEDIVGQVLSAEISSLFPSSSTTALDYANSLIDEYSKSDCYEDRVHAADLMSLTDSPSDSITSLIMSFVSRSKPALSSLLRAKQIIDERYGSLSSQFKCKARVLYPLADEFSA